MESELRCAMCNFVTSVHNPRALNYHISRWHKHDSNFTVSCPYTPCCYSTKSWNAYRIHISRSKHTDLNSIQYEQFTQTAGETDSETPYETYEQINDTNIADIMLENEIKYCLELQVNCNLSNNSVDKVLDVTKTLLAENTAQTLKKAKLCLEQSGIPTSVLDDINNIDELPFETLSSQHKRESVYLRKCNLLNPVEVLLGRKAVSKKGTIAMKNSFGYIIPFKSLLENILSSPEIMFWVQNPHSSKNEIMKDLCDGQYYEHNDLFRDNHRALQIILYTDDIVIVNPIGTHVRKYKITMFYITLGNIPPQFRSKLQTIFLIGMAHENDLKQFGIDSLLKDFISTITELSTNGVDLNINSKTEKFFGNIVMIPADTPAANRLGGFKEGVSFAYKACRKCNALSQEWKSSFFHRDFNIREFSTHLERCETLSSLSKDARNYWSKVWGINDKSFLCSIPNSPITETLVQDPMHVLLEGLIPLELQLFLFHAIVEQNFFSLDYLNRKLSGFNYSYLDRNRPETIRRDDIVKTKKIKQTSSGILTLCSLLPLMIGDKIPQNDKKWDNLLMLFKITHIVTSPYTTLDTIGQLEQLIASHHMLFKTLYPDASFVPKMHYLVHIPEQMKLYGPGRHQWCMRFEAKHAYFKNLKTRCFKNILKTLSKKHQLYLCSKQLGCAGQFSENFLYSGDEINSGELINLFDYPGYISLLQKLYPGKNWQDNPNCFQCTELDIHGLSYKCGCFLLLSFGHDNVPIYGFVEDIIVVESEKLFLVNVCETVYYEPHINSHIIQLGEKQTIVSWKSLDNPWPRNSYIFGDNMCIVNKLSHIFEF